MMSDLKSAINASLRKNSTQEIQELGNNKNDRPIITINELIDILNAFPCTPTKKDQNAYDRFCKLVKEREVILTRPAADLLRDEIPKIMSEYNQLGFISSNQSDRIAEIMCSFDDFKQAICTICELESETAHSIPGPNGTSLALILPEKS